MAQELIALDRLPEMPPDWDYGASVTKLKQVIYKWKTLTIELATELYIAREALSRSGRPYGGHTWDEYCRDIGTERHVVNGWLARWFPKTTGNSLPVKPSPLPNGKYRTIVIDPPWPMEKSGRDVRPTQGQTLDYPVMEIDEIKAFPLKELVADDCHVYLWTTHRFLPAAFDVFREWGVTFHCLLTWVKNVGFTPYSWMFSTEHCLFGWVGTFSLLKVGQRVDFYAPVREHSRKPEEFYDMIRGVSPDPRIDLFSREKHDGFDQWGSEVDRFVGAKR